MQRFTGYRHNISQRDSHAAQMKNADDEPQYEGVIWSDGSCTIKWLTSVTSTSVFASFADFVTIHGHPEYGTEIVFHDGKVPLEWLDACARWKLQRDHGLVLA